MLAQLRFFYSLVGLSFFVPVIAGLYTGRGGAPEVFASILAGIATTVSVELATEGAGIGGLTPNFLGLLAASVGFLLVAWGRARGRAGPEAKTGETQ